MLCPIINTPNAVCCLKGYQRDKSAIFSHHKGFYKGVCLPIHLLLWAWVILSKKLDSCMLIGTWHENVLLIWILTLHQCVLDFTCILTYWTHSVMFNTVPCGSSVLYRSAYKKKTLFSFGCTATCQTSLPYDSSSRSVIAWRATGLHFRQPYVARIEVQRSNLLGALLSLWYHANWPWSVKTLSIVCH